VNSNSKSEQELDMRVEALLFAAAGTTTVGQIAQALNVTPLRVERALDSLAALYKDRGIRLQRHQGELQLTTAPEYAQDVEKFLKLESSTRLTQAAIEVLAIVAYEQPVTRPQIDAIRGVNSDSVLKTLLRYGMVVEAGRSESPGRPILYQTSAEFLQQFGLNNLDELPALIPNEPQEQLNSDSVNTPMPEL
jgi:segregation and condensation protein B